MLGDLYINRTPSGWIDAFDRYGVSMGDNFLDTLEQPLEFKEFVTDESRLKHGKVVIVDDTPRVASRDITLNFTIMGEGKGSKSYRYRKNKFLEMLYNINVELYVPSLGNMVFKLIYTGKSVSYNTCLDREFGCLAVGFTEPNPFDRSMEDTSTTTIEPTPTTASP